MMSLVGYTISSRKTTRTTGGQKTWCETSLTIQPGRRQMGELIFILFFFINNYDTASSLCNPSTFLHFSFFALTMTLLWIINNTEWICNWRCQQNWKQLLKYLLKYIGVKTLNKLGMFMIVYHHYDFFF